MVTIYLVGQISYKEEITYQWRKDFKERFSGNKFNVFHPDIILEFGNKDSDVRIIDPCDNEFNKSEFGGNVREVISNDETNLLVPKDYTYVLDSDILVANLNHYDKSKDFIGTIYELAWGYADPEKAVIGIYDGDPKENYMTNHPFVRSTIDTWVKNEEEAFDIIVKYFL